MKELIRKAFKACIDATAGQEGQYLLIRKRDERYQARRIVSHYQI